MEIVTSTWFGPASATVTVPIEPEIPRLFELRLKVIELADAIGVMAKAAAIHKIGTATFKLVIRTARFSIYDEVVPFNLRF
jgi:hypothetical protein